MRETTVSTDPVVATLPENLRPNLIRLLNGWRDDMPEIDPKFLEDTESQLVAVSVGGKVVGGYLLAPIPMAFEMIGLAIAPEHRRQGLGRMCCMDALFRAGKRPLVLTANDASAPFAKQVGFKIVGKRKAADGTTLTRFGWHAPRPTGDPNHPLAC